MAGKAHTTEARLSTWIAGPRYARSADTPMGDVGAAKRQYASRLPHYSEKTRRIR